MTPEYVRCTAGEGHSSELQPGAVKYSDVLHNVVGCTIAFRREIAPTPCLEERLLVRVGKEARVAHGVSDRAAPEILADIRHTIPSMKGYMREGGVGPPFLSRLRGRIKREIAKLRKR